jgi:hypothetical protein
MAELVNSGAIASGVDLTDTFTRHACQTSDGRLAFDNKLPNELSSKVMVDALSGKYEIAKAIEDSGAKLPACGPDKGVATGYKMRSP